MGRLHNCIVALAELKILLYDTTIQYTYDASLKYEVHTLNTPLTHKHMVYGYIPLVTTQVKELLNPEVMKEITETAQQMEVTD